MEIEESPISAASVAGLKNISLLQSTASVTDCGNKNKFLLRADTYSRDNRCTPTIETNLAKNVLHCKQLLNKDNKHGNCIQLTFNEGDINKADETVIYIKNDLNYMYEIIEINSTFIVKLTKGTRGLGLSVTGGIDSTGSWPGLIRIKRLFPHQPASSMLKKTTLTMDTSITAQNEEIIH
ncbi:hypothetical protein NQ317_011743 [Molorchus minor]|uniref:PDZ domain-containing protein n=1 Tax=Molorchus minor TaxID=1323400 RepID=A0ABQ9J4I3_9CUCU|nr:hypothetical protein NQ317_011743 [Molorchus minor]